jgi:enoyl-CoA hydratase/carnithine racemase
MTEALKIERRGAALWMTIDRPEKRNALNDEVFAGINKALQMSEADEAVRALVITGSGDKAFCSGADLDPNNSAFAKGLAEPRHPGGQTYRALMNHPKPVIARINGACMAGGMGLLAAADLVVAADHARFGLPEVKVGVFPMMVDALLIGRVGLSDRDLCELSFLGDPIDAQRALAMKLITRVVPAAQLDAEIDGMLETIATRSPTALRMGKFAIGQMRGMTGEAALAYAETQIRLLGLTEDAREGVLAFSEKRSPNWTGR